MFRSIMQKILNNFVKEKFNRIGNLGKILVLFENLRWVKVFGGNFVISRRDVGKDIEFWIIFGTRN